MDSMESRVWARIGVVKRRRRRVRGGLICLAVLGVAGLGWYSWVQPPRGDAGWGPPVDVAVVEEISAQTPPEETAWSLPAEEVILAGVF